MRELIIDIFETDIKKCKRWVTPYVEDEKDTGSSRMERRFKKMCVDTDLDNGLDNYYVKVKLF